MVRDAMQVLDVTRDPTMRVTFPAPAERDEPNALEPDELARFLDEMKVRGKEHYALVATLAFTGLRFCHASAIRWEDIDEAKNVIHIKRKQVRGHVGPVSRKKQAPREIPMSPEHAAILRQHRVALGVLGDGWAFPSEKGTLRTPGGLWKAWRVCLRAAGITERFTIHGLRRTFNDLTRRAGVDGVVIRSLTGHVTEKMRSHYSTVRLEEKRAAVANVVRLVRSGDASGDGPEKEKRPDERELGTGRLS
jgi:integrase